MLTLPKLTQTLFAQLHDSTWRLHDEGTQIAKAKKLAMVIIKEFGGRKDVNVSVQSFKSKWMAFHENSKTDRKTRVFRIYNIAPGELLGEIKWSGNFRSYCFFPVAGFCFSLIDLADIQEFIGLLMAEREAVQDKKKIESERDVLK